jgi:(S)-3,5-dihydroxyphenylglycine transaminase
MLTDIDLGPQSPSEAMNFLNEVVIAFPDAISFGPGRPLESLFDVRAALAHVESYVEAISGALGVQGTYGRLGQYGETNGMIREDVARYLQTDEGLEVSASETLVTVGCQEAMLMVLMALFDPARDVLLVADPAYVGITGPAAMLRIPIWPVPHGFHGLDPADVAAAAAAVRARGRTPRALYHVPTFNNPLGTVMTAGARHRLLEVAADQDLLILEDNAYGPFAYDGEPPPTLASLDREGRVIYLGSFSKSLFPGLRVGYLVYRNRSSIEKLSRVKSYTTVNTSPLLQAVVGGVLRANGHSLKAIIEPKRAQYRRQRDQMLDSLTAAMAEVSDRVSWSRPAGGFFLSVTLPFEFDDAHLRVCAREYGVICTPMRYFSSTGSWNDVVRLSFSYTSPQEIDRGIHRFAAFVAGQCRR